MTDEQITEACRLALGWKHLGAVGVAGPKPGEPDPPGLWCLSGGNDWWRDPEGNPVCGRCESLPDPLHDRAQAMALVEEFSIHLFRDGKDAPWEASIGDSQPAAEASNKDLNLAICACVAKLPQP